MRTITNKMNAMMIANKMNKITKTYAMNVTTMAKETTTFENGMIAAIVCEAGNLTCDDQIEGLEEHWFLSHSGAGKSLMHDSIETHMTVKCFEYGSNIVEDDCSVRNNQSCIFEPKPKQDRKSNGTSNSLTYHIFAMKQAESSLQKM